MNAGPAEERGEQRRGTMFIGGVVFGRGSVTLFGFSWAPTISRLFWGVRASLSLLLILAPLS
jgi:hypothetical protein